MSERKRITMDDTRKDWEQKMAEWHGCKYENGVCVTHGGAKAEKPKKGKKVK